MAVTGESLVRLFVELGLADDTFLAGVKNALTECGRLRDGVVKAGKVAADGIKPLATAFVNVTEAEKRAVAQTVAAAATEKARAQTLGITTAQLRELDRAQKAAADSAVKQAAASTAAAKAERAQGQAAAASAAALAAPAKTRGSVSGALGMDRAARGDTRFGSVAATGSTVQVVPREGTTEQVAQLAALGLAVAGVTSVLKDSVTEASKYANAFLGLRSVARAFGEDEERAVKAAEALAQDGLLPAAAAAQGFKNALASGYSIEESIKLLEGLKEQAIFNRQAHYDLGGAIIATTEGIKNEQSILADATGTTTNLSQMWKVYAEQLGKAPGQLSAAEKRQAAYNGFLMETARSAGDLAKAQETLAGTIAKSDTAVKLAKVSLGDALTPAYRAFLTTITAVSGAFAKFAEQFPGVTAGIATAVVTLGTMATGLYAARTAALMFQASLGPVGLALAAVSLAVGVAVASYTAFSDATNETTEAQEELTKALSATGVEASLKRQSLAMEALAEAERDLNDATGGVFKSSQKEIAVLEAKAAARRRDLIAANAAVKVEGELAEERDRVGAQTDATEAAEKKLADLREENMTEPARLEAEMNRVLNSMAKATPDVLEGIREEYMTKIAAVQSKAAASGESSARKLQAQIDAARKSVEQLQAIAEEADANALSSRAQVGGEDPAIAELEAKLRMVADTTEKAISDARKISDEQARSAAMDAAVFVGQEAKDAIVREWTANGELAATAEADAYEQKRIDRQRTVAAMVNKIDLARMDESERLTAERDQVLIQMYDATEEEKLVITESYNQQIADSDAKLAQKRLDNANKIRDAYLSTFTQIVGKVESVAGTMVARHAEQIGKVREQLQAAKDGEIEMTATQKRELEEREKTQVKAYRAAFAVQKAMAIASTVVNTATAIMSLYSQLPLPAAIIASVAVGALGAVQIGIIAAEKPEFKQGGMITNADRRASPGSAQGASVVADLHVGEGVLTAERGMKAVGGEAGLRLLNMGMPVGAAAGLSGGRVRGSATPPEVMAGGSGGTSSQGTTNVRVALDGKTVDDVQINRWNNGTSKVQRRVYLAAGVRVGLDR